MFRLNEELKAFYRARYVDDRCELSDKVISGGGNDFFPIFAGPGIKGATV